MALGRQGDGGSLVKSALSMVVGVAPMQHKAIVPHDDIADLPLIEVRKKNGIAGTQKNRVKSSVLSFR